MVSGKKIMSCFWWWVIQSIVILKPAKGFLKIFLSDLKNKKKNNKKKINRGPPRVSKIREQCKKLTKHVPYFAYKRIVYLQFMWSSGHKNPFFDAIKMLLYFFNVHIYSCFLSV